MIDFFCEKTMKKVINLTLKIKFRFFCENISKNIYIFEN